MQQQRFKLTAPVKHSKTHGLKGMGLGLDRQRAVDQMFELVGDRIKSFMWSQIRLLVGYNDPLLLLLKAHQLETMVGSLSISGFMKCSTACIFHILCS